MDCRRMNVGTRVSALLTLILLSGCIFPAILTLYQGDFAGKVTPQAAADSPILVDGDSGWASVPGISGDGSQGTPYVIKDKVIDAGASGDCIRIQNTTKYFIVRNCTLTNAGAKPASNIYLWNVSNGLLERNNCSKTIGNGILNSFSSNVTILENNVTECDNAIGLFWCGNVSIVANNASLCTTAGIQVDTNSTNVTVENNTVTNNDFGIVISQNSTWSVVENNFIATHDFIGIYFFRSRNNTARNNKIYDSNMGGIYLADNCHNNTIEGNSVELNPGEGIFLTGGCKNNTILRNNVTSSALHGVELQSTCDGNLVYLNRLVLNTAGNGLDGASFNLWDNGSRGNYWSDYTGVDDNDDGIGDTAWTVLGSAGSQDHFPLWRDTEHPVHIVGDDGWALYRAAGNCTGSGTSVDPYVVDGMWYDAEGTTSGVWIENSTVPFIIQFCTANNSAPQPHAGIHLTNVSNGRLSKNDCSNNSGAGILVEKNCSYIIIEDNTLNQNGYGAVLFQEGFNISLVHNKATRNFAGNVGITVASGPFINLTIAKNNASNNGYYGINLVTYAANVSIYDNYVENHTNAGVHLWDCNTTYVWNNTLKGNTQGIYLESGNSYCEFRENKITGGTSGIYIGDCSFSEFEGNTISGNSYGIRWIQGNNNTVLRNNITGTFLYAIYFDTSGQNNSILWNNMSNNQDVIGCSVGANMAHNNTVAFNSFEGATGSPVGLQAGNNGWLFYGNAFPSADYILDDGSWTRWDNGSLGNLWNEYTGVDADDDFIGDSPHTIPSSGAQDNYPIWDDGDDVAPVVTITGMNVDQLCGGTAPSYGLTLADAYAVEDTWVSYDNGLNNHTCGTGGTLPDWGDVGNGSVTVTFYANDTGDNIGQASITLWKDIAPPVISSSGLTPGASFASAPTFSLVIAEANFFIAWYSVDGGTTNHTLVGLSGTIDAAVWASLPAGGVMIVFWANDTLGNTGTAVVNVVKVSSTCEECGDLTLYWIIGGVITVGVIMLVGIIIKKYKNRALYPNEAPALK